MEVFLRSTIDFNWWILKALNWCPIAQILSHSQITIASAGVSSIVKNSNVRVTTGKSVDLMIEFHAGYFLFIYRFDCFDSIKRKTNKQNIFFWRLNSIDLLFFRKTQTFPVLGQRKSAIRSKHHSTASFPSKWSWKTNHLRNIFYDAITCENSNRSVSRCFSFFFFFSRPLYKHIFWALPWVFFAWNFPSVYT